MLKEIWTEKYRPKRLKDVIGQEYIVERLKAFVESRSLPHCLFAGPSGSGKTTCALAIANELYGSLWRNNFLELNASDERGIETIRVKVKDFARTLPFGKNQFKIIYLDEADSLTKDAQHALRRTMENYVDTARFILSVNYSSKIIPPIQSRTAIFRFSPLAKEQIINFLKTISKKERLDADDKALEAIVYLSEGDMRRAINTLQTAAAIDGKITEKTIYNISSKADPERVRKMLIMALGGDFIGARKELNLLMFEQGLSGEDIIKEIHNQVFSLGISDRAKLHLLEKIGEYEFRLTEGSNERIQLEALLAQMMLLGEKTPSS
jgi:replication factor C small subunit